MSGMNEKGPDPKMVMTGTFRLSFPNLFTPREGDNGKLLYDLKGLIPKAEDISPMRAALKAAGVEKWGADVKAWPKGVMDNLPIKDGDQKADLQGYAGHYVFGASSKMKPGVIDQKKNDILSEDGGVYAGCYCRATLRAYAWEHKNEKGAIIKRGISFGLQNVQKVRDGEPFGGRRKASDEFGELPDDAPASGGTATDGSDDLL